MFVYLHVLLVYCDSIYIYIHIYMLLYALYCTSYATSNAMRKYLRWTGSEVKPGGLSLT